jgi:hypothetical protein
VKVDAIVTRLVDYSDSKHYPVYAFQDKNKRYHEVYTDVLAKYSTNAAPGDTVTLIYVPDAPGHAQRGDFGTLWKHTVNLFIFGSVSLALGLGVLLIARSQ